MLNVSKLKIGSGLLMQKTAPGSYKFTKTNSTNVESDVILLNDSGIYLLNPFSTGTVALNATGKELVTAEWVRALQALPPGSIIYSASATVLTGFFKCNAAAISRTTYSGLYSAIGDMYGAGNGVSSFNLPELRGEFLRVFDDGRGIDVGRTLGSWQTHMFEAHNHTANIAIASDSGASANFGAGTSSVTGNRSVSSVGGTETRPRNVALHALIKW